MELSELFILLVNDLSNIRSIRSTVALRGNVEFTILQFGEFSVKELQKGVDVLCGDWRVVDGGRIRRVAEADVGRLVEEDHVGVIRPAVRIDAGVDKWSRSRGVSLDAAWAELEEQTSGRRTAWSTVQPGTSPRVVST